MPKPIVILRECPTYDSDRITQLTREAFERLQLKPHGRTLIKPNCVMSGEFFPHAYTRPEFLEGIIRATREQAGDTLEELAVGERCGITVPTRYTFKNAGYYDLFKKLGGVKHYHFEEETQVEIPLYHPERLRDNFFTPEPVAKADFFINCPKFKAHPWTTVTFSLKAYIGIQDDRHRLIDHDHKLNEKVADLQYIIQPQFIAIDAITAGEGRMLTPLPFDLGMVLYGNNQVAFDAVCCHIIGLDPIEVDHIRMSYERGFGPIDLKDIEVVGDINLEQAKARAKGFKTGLVRVEDYFKGTNVQAYGGPPPGGTGTDYCWGGCPGALEEAIEIIRALDQGADAKIPRVHLVFGAYDGPIDAKEGEKVVFIGDCATFNGELHGKAVKIPSLYKDRSTLDPHYAKGTDPILKSISSKLKFMAEKKKDIIRITGCPVSVADQVLALVELSEGLKDPFMDPRIAPQYVSTYFTSKTKSSLDRLMGKPYQKNGPVQRGASRPPQNLPPEGVDTPLEVGATTP